MGGGDGRPGEHGHHVAHARQAGALTQKKSLIAVEQDVDARARWWDEVAALDPADLVFLDETSTSMAMTPSHAWAPRGERAIGVVPQGKGRTVSLLAALTPDGIAASVAIEGAVDRAVFDAFIAEQLVPRLRPGQVVILDNLNVHKSAVAQRLIEAAGGTLRFLPTYSPDFNPIEQVFSAVKTRLRRAAARTFETLMTALGHALDAVTAAHARACYRAVGYAIEPGQPL
jgi:transposase